MVQPQLVQPPISVPVEELDPSRTGTGHLRTAAIDEGTEIVNQNDPALAGIHPEMMPGVAVIRRPDLPQGRAQRQANRHHAP